MIILGDHIRYGRSRMRWFQARPSLHIELIRANSLKKLSSKGDRYPRDCLKIVYFLIPLVKFKAKIDPLAKQFARRLHGDMEIHM